MRRARIGLWFATLMWAGVSSTARGAHAQAAPSDGATAAEGGSPTARAQKHFARARELYAAGSYRDAITELEAAHELDPSAKDLVYNLALVNEKLGKIDEALDWMQKYERLPLDASERARAEAAVRRLEGAKREIEAQRAAAAPVTPAPPPAASAPSPAAAPPAPPPPQRGRVDALTLGAAGVAVAGFVVGGVFGVMALGEKPSSSFVTGRDGTYADLASHADDAHAHARVADVALAVGVVFTVTAAILYFARTKPSASASRSATALGPLLGGAF